MHFIDTISQNSRHSLELIYKKSRKKRLLFLNLKWFPIVSICSGTFYVWNTNRKIHHP